MSINTAEVSGRSEEILTRISEWRKTKDFSQLAFNGLGEAKKGIGKGLRLMFCNRNVPPQLKLLLGVGALAAGMYAMSATLGRGKEAYNAATMKGNHYGSIWWSGAQSLLHTGTLGLTASALLFPPLGAALAVCPIVAILPSATAFCMDYVQEICTDPNHWINKKAQWGLDNIMINTKSATGGFVTFTPKLKDWWIEKIRGNDGAIMASLGMPIDRPDVITSREKRYSWMS